MMDYETKLKHSKIWCQMKLWDVFLLKLCLDLVLKLSNGQLTTLTTPVCPRDEAAFMCEQPSTSIAVRWTVSLPETVLVTAVPRSQVGSQMITFMNDPGYGFVMTLETTASGNFNSTLKVVAVQELNGARVECAGTTLLLQIMINAPPAIPDVISISEAFQSGYVDLTIQWNNPPVSSDVTYAVNVTPPVESSVVVGGASAQLRVMYNTRYSVRIVATNCAGNSSNVTNLYYVDCGSPIIGSNVVVEGVVPPRVAQGTNVTFKCQSGQSYILTGPAVATCSSSGLWEPDTSAVQCIANCGHAIASRNVQVMYNSTLEGATVVFKCNEGFSPNVTHTGICHNNSMWYRDPADLVCVNPFGVDCGSPSPPAGGSITSLTDTLEGSRVTFRCDDGSLEMYAECQPDGNWEPNPTQFDCTQGTMMSGPSSYQLSYGGALTLTGVICSTVFFVIGTVFGMLCSFLILRHKQSHANKNDQPAETQPPLPVYEDIHVTPRSTGNKQSIELKENVAYGPI